MLKKIDKLRRILLLTLIGGCLGVSALTGCGKEDSKVVFTTGLGKDEVFRIGDEICKKPEMMVYLTTTQNQYESVYGPEIWKTSRNGVTLEDSVKDTVLEKLAQVKSMYLLAKSKGIKLEAAEEKLVESAAKSYFGSLSDTQKQYMGVTEDTLIKLYTEYTMANKVYREIIKDVTPEISDDEARIITVQHILIRTYTRDVDGNRVDFLTADKQSAYEEACEVREQAVAGGKSFEELAARYSQDTTLTYSFGKGEMSPAFEAAAFQLATNEISAVVESESGYHVIKCISTFDQEETKANKQRLLEERRNQAFGREYETFVDALARKLNQNAWDEIGLMLDETVPPVDFFEIYERIFG